MPYLVTYSCKKYLILMGKIINFLMTAMEVVVGGVGGDDGGGGDGGGGDGGGSSVDSNISVCNLSCSDVLDLRSMTR